jgi:hypothetical protein
VCHDIFGGSLNSRVFLQLAKYRGKHVNSSDKINNEYWVFEACAVAFQILKENYTCNIP